MTERPSPPQPSLPPQVAAGRYEVGAQLGEGGMATVYRAYDRKTGEWCALKVLLPRLSERAGIRARFTSEAQAMMRLAHRNVIHVFDVQTDGPRPYFAMELAEGGCLVDWIETYGPMPARMAADVAIQICKGIGAAHRGGVIHRDIKPHNILVNRRGVCKITDFGIAQFDDDAAGITKTGSVMGTLGYIAPEQRANAKNVDERADIYSVGATLFTLVTARTTMDLFFADREPELLKGVPEALIPVIMRATRYRRDDRYPTVRALAKALYHARATLPEDPPDTPSIIMRDELPETPNLQPNRTPTTGGVGLSRSGESVLGPAQVTYTTPAPAARRDARYEAPRSLAATPRPVSRSHAPEGTPRPVSRSHAPEGTPRPVSRSQAPEGTPSQEPRSDAPQGFVSADSSPSLVPQYTGSRAASMPPREALLRQRHEQQPIVDWRRVLRRTVAISAPIVALIFILSMYGTLGASVLDTQRSGTHAARDVWFEVVEREQLLLEDLVGLGSDRQPLLDAWQAMVSAETPADRARLTDDWLELAKRELVAHTPRSNTSRNYARAREARMRIQRLDGARDTYLKQRVEWQRASKTPHGSFAIWLGFAPPPDG